MTPGISACSNAVSEPSMIGCSAHSGWPSQCAQATYEKETRRSGFEPSNSEKFHSHSNING
jgi:hypothetical protein